MITIDPPIEKLTLAERYDLLARIEETLPATGSALSEAHLQLLRERKLAADEGRNATIDYDTAMARLRASKA